MTAQPVTPRVRIQRVLPGTPEQVFDAWINPRKAALWMAPGAMTVARFDVDAQVGGAFELVMRGNDGEHVRRGKYVEIDRPKRLVFTWITGPTTDEPSIVSIELRPVFGGTELTLVHEKLPADEVEPHRQGWTSIDEKMAEGIRSAA